MPTPEQVIYGVLESTLSAPRAPFTMIVTNKGPESEQVKKALAQDSNKWLVFADAKDRNTSSDTAEAKSLNHIIPGEFIRLVLQKGILLYLQGKNDAEKSLGKKIITSLYNIANPYCKGQPTPSVDSFLAAIENNAFTRLPKNKTDANYNTIKADKDIFNTVFENIYWSKGNVYLGIYNKARGPYHGGADPNNVKLDTHMLRFYEHNLLRMGNVVPTSLLDADIEKDMASKTESDLEKIRLQAYIDIREMKKAYKKFETEVFMKLMPLLKNSPSVDTKAYDEYLKLLDKCADQFGELRETPLFDLRLTRMSQDMDVNQARNTQEMEFLLATQLHQQSQTEPAADTPTPLGEAACGATTEEAFNALLKSQTDQLYNLANLSRKRSPGEQPLTCAADDLTCLKSKLAAVVTGECEIRVEQLTEIHNKLCDIYRLIQDYKKNAPPTLTTTSAGKLDELLENYKKIQAGVSMLLENIKKPSAEIRTPGDGSDTPLPRDIEESFGSYSTTFQAEIKRVRGGVAKPESGEEIDRTLQITYSDNAHATINQAVLSDLQTEFAITDTVEGCKNRLPGQDDDENTTPRPEGM